MKKATIITHQGWADLYSSNGLVNYYADMFDELIIFSFDENRKKMLDVMYKHLQNVKIQIPQYTNKSVDKATCIICHTNICAYGPCPREPHNLCKFIDYSKYQDYENIKIGAFKQFELWNEELKKTKSFSHAFYSFEGLNPDVRWSRFRISEIKQKELPAKPYMVLHDDPERGMKISLQSKNRGIYNLNMKSENMIDQIEIIQNSDEIHMIDSNYSVLIYFLSFVDEKIKNIPKYLHTYTRQNRDLKIYQEPTPEKWYTL